MNYIIYYKIFTIIYQLCNVAANNVLIIQVGTTGLSIIMCFMWCFIARKVVMLKVISLVLLFMIRVRFPADKSIVYILRSRCGNTLVEEVRKFEKIAYKIRKCKLDIVLLETCLENKIICGWTWVLEDTSAHATSELR